MTGKSLRDLAFGVDPRTTSDRAITADPRSQRHPGSGNLARVADGPIENSGDVFVRPATTGDGRAIGEVHAAAWRSGFDHFLSVEFLQRAAAGRQTGWPYAIKHVLAVANLVFVAGRDDRVLAFSQSGPPDDGGAGLEIFAFYCDPIAWGTGLSERLLRDTCMALSERATRVILWTPDDAHRAHRFYERCGFALTGRTRRERLSDWQPTPSYEDVAAVEYALALS
jgi:GNAT superfamily N-acetyltransferase